jgi:hypothetical protein
MPDDVFDKELVEIYGLKATETSIPSTVRRIVFQGMGVPAEKVRVIDKVPLSILHDVDCSDIVKQLQSTFRVQLLPLEIDEPKLDDVIGWVLTASRREGRLT